MTTPANIAVGVAGWSYPDWRGYVYGGRVGDPLRFVAGFLDMLEINSSFYRAPSAAMVSSWVERTRELPGFFFTAKLHQDVTHKGELAPSMAHAFHDGFAPMISVGMLKHLLAQFRWDFADSPETRRHLNRIKAEYGDMANVTLELRHMSWQTPLAMEFLQSLGATVANLDYPLARDSFNLRLCTIGAHAYLRLHGRNTQAWFNKGAGRDLTYDYLYNPREVGEIVTRAAELAGRSASLTIVANNHYQGKELVNALQIKSQLSGNRVNVPPTLLRRYPDLSACATPYG